MGKAGLVAVLAFGLAAQAAAPAPAPAIPSWFWGCWRIARDVTPAGALVGMSQAEVDALIGGRISLEPGRAAAPRSGLTGPMPGVSTVVLQPLFRARRVSEKEFSEGGRFASLAEIGVSGGSAIEVTLQSSTLSDLDFVAADIYLRPKKRELILGIEGVYLLATKANGTKKGGACTCGSGARKKP